MKKALSILLLVAQCCYAGRTAYIQTVQDLTVNGTLTLNGGSSGSGFPGQYTLDSGSASAPSLSHSGDANTGLYFPTNDQIGFVTGGVSRLRLLNTGNIDNSSAGSSDTLDSVSVGGMLITGPGGAAKAHGVFVGNTDITGSQVLWLTNPDFSRQFNMQLTNSSHAVPDTAYLQTTATGGMRILSTAGNIDLRVGDSAGAKKISVQNHGDSEVASIDSLGAVGALSYNHIGDADTGLSFPSNDALNLTIGGAPSFKLSLFSGYPDATRKFTFRDNSTDFLSILYNFGGAAFDAGNSNISFNANEFGNIDFCLGGINTVKARFSTAGLLLIKPLLVEHADGITISGASGDTYGKVRALKGSSVDSETAINLSADGAGTGKLTIPDANSAHRYRVEVTMFATAGTNAGKAAAFTFEFLAKNVSGTVTEVGNSDMKTVAVDSGLTWTCGVGSISGTTVNLTTAADAASTVTSRALITEVGTQ